MNCKHFEHEIGIADAPHMLSEDARRHAANCSSCTTRRDEHIALKRLMRDLNDIVVPTDFDLQLRARLADHRVAAPTRLFDLLWCRLPRLFDQPLYVKVAACCLPLLFIAITLNHSSPTAYEADTLVASSGYRGGDSETSEQNRTVTPAPLRLASNGGRAKVFIERKTERSNIPGVRDDARRTRINYALGTKTVTAKQTVHEREMDASEFSSGVPVTVSTRGIEVTRRDGQGAGQPLILDAVSFGDNPLTQTAKLTVKGANTQQGVW